MKKKLMEHKKPQYHTGVLSKGRAVSAVYDSERRGIMIYISRRLTPEVMGGCRSISELNKKYNTNSTLSKNKKSLITVVPLSPEASYALRGVLKKSLSDYRKEGRGKAYQFLKKKKVEDVSSLARILVLAEEEIEGKFEGYK